MKKLLLLLMALIVALCAFTACSGEDDGNKNDGKDDKYADLINGDGIVFKINKYEANSGYSGGNAGGYLCIGFDKDGALVGSLRLDEEMVSYNDDGPESKLCIDMIIDGEYLYMRQERSGGYSYYDSYKISDYIKAFLARSVSSEFSEIIDLDTADAEDLVRGILDILKGDFLDSLGNYKESANDTLGIDIVGYIRNLLAAFGITESNNGAVTIKPDFNAIKSLNQKAYTQKASEFIETLFGKNSYSKIKAAVPGVLALDLDDVVDIFEDNGGDIDDAVAAIDAILALITGENEVTLEGMMGVEMSDILNNTELMNTSLRSVILSYCFPEGADYSDLDDALDSVYSMLESKTIYELIFGDSTEAANSAKSELDAILTELKTCASVNIAFDKNHKLTSAKIELKLDDSLGNMPMGAYGGMSISLNATRKGDVTSFAFTYGLDNELASDYITTKLEFEGELIENKLMSYDKAALKEIKDNIAKVPTLNANNYTDILGERYSDEEYYDYELGDWVHPEEPIEVYTPIRKGGKVIGVSLNRIDFYYPREDGENLESANLYFDDLCNTRVSPSSGYYCQGAIAIRYDFIIELNYESHTQRYTYSLWCYYDPIGERFISEEEAEHDMTIDEEKSYEPADCESEGLYYYYCSKCDRIKEEYYTKGHSFGSMDYVEKNGKIYLTHSCVEEYCDYIHERELIVNSDCDYELNKNYWEVDIIFDVDFSGDYEIEIAQDENYYIYVYSDNDYNENGEYYFSAGDKIRIGIAVYNDSFDYTTPITINIIRVD